MTDVVFAHPEEAEAAFYRAFENADLDAMMQVWLDADYVECIHPMSHRLMGIDAIRNSWQEIFKNSSHLLFETLETHRIKQNDLAVHVVNEHFTVKDNQTVQILATNIYERTPQGWRMILHHASPTPKPTTEPNRPTVH